MIRHRSDRQGPDIGDQYRSEIFYLNDDQKKIAEKYLKILRIKGLKIATALTKASEFYPAEDIIRIIISIMAKFLIAMGIQKGSDI